MHVKPWGLPIFIVVGVALWIVVTLAAAAVVIRAPAENAGLGVALVLIWVALIAMAAMSRLTEWIGRGR